MDQSTGFTADQARSLLEDPRQSLLWQRIETDEPYQQKKRDANTLKVAHRKASASQALVTSRVAILAQRLLDNDNPKEAESVCRRALASVQDSDVEIALKIKLLDSLTRQVKLGEAEEICDSIPEKQSHPWVLFFEIIINLDRRNYEKSLHLLQEICTYENLNSGAIDRRVVFLACGISLLAGDAGLLIEFASLIPFAAESTDIQELICFRYLRPSAQEVLESIEAIDNSSSESKVNDNIKKLGRLLIGPVFSRWNLCHLSANAICPISTIESNLIDLSTTTGICETSGLDLEPPILALSIIHYATEQSPFSDRLEIFQMLSKYKNTLNGSLKKLHDTLHKEFSKGYLYNASDSVTFALHLEEPDMNSIFNKICSDYSAFRMQAIEEGCYGRWDTLTLSEIVPVAELDIDFNMAYSNAIIEFIREIRRITSNQELKRIYLLPWLKTGGADKVAIDWINYCSEVSRETSLIILTERGDSEWLGRIRQEVAIVKSADFIGSFTLDQQAYALTLCIQYLRPNIVHNINSNLGYIAAEKHSKFLTNSTNLACHIFCNDIDRYGQIDGYAFRHSTAIYSYFKYVFSDNKTFLGENISLLSKYSDLSRNENQILTHIYVPTEVPFSSWSRLAPSRRGFWTGRFDRQKRLDILEDVALRLPNVIFDVYGKIILDGDEDHLNRLASIKNINIIGPYESFYSLPYSEYDFYIMTSQWEGLPNTLLEAASLGIPIIAPNVGGIKEFLDNSTGYLVEQFDRIDRYVDCINSIHENFDEATKRGIAAKERIRSRHSFETMKNKLAAISYL